MDLLAETMKAAAAFQDADLTLSDLDVQVETAERQAWEQEELAPWVTTTAAVLRMPPSLPGLPSVAERLRKVSGQNLAALPNIVGAMQREMAGRGLDSRRIEVVDKFLTMFARLLGE